MARGSWRIKAGVPWDFRLLGDTGVLRNLASVASETVRSSNVSSSEPSDFA